MEPFKIFKNVSANATDITELEEREMHAILPEEDKNLDERMALEAARLRMLKKKVNADSWTNELEDLMKAWGEKAAGYRELHRKAGQLWSSRSNRMYIPLMMFTTLGGVTTFSSLGGDTNIYMMAVLGALNVSSALLASVTKFYKPDEKAMNHRQVARAFGSFYRKVMLQLSMSREERQPADILTDWASTEYDRLQKEAPSLPGVIVDDYKIMHKDVVNKPDVVTEEFVIAIYPRE
jgi:hypothetical protein